LELHEQLLRLGRRGPELRPFCKSAGVRHRGYSQRLQRVVVDFGAEHSFAKAAERVREHYGIDVSVEAIRQQTLRHGRSIHQLGPEPLAPAKTLIVQMDGTMIPVMEAGKGSDRRKDKQLLWREARLCLARPSDKKHRLFMGQRSEQRKRPLGCGERSRSKQVWKKKLTCMGWATVRLGLLISFATILATRVRICWISTM
jgi:hypothetical protein